jgi:hypothetical protein
VPRAVFHQNEESAAKFGGTHPFAIKRNENAKDWIKPEPFPDTVEL